MTTPAGSGYSGPVPGVPDWWVFRGSGRPRPHLDLAAQLPPPPPWRTFRGEPHLPPPPEDKEGDRLLGTPPMADTAPPEGSARRALIDKVNASLFLRRPLLLTGPPGSGKSSLAHQISRELGLGRVLRWSVNSRSTVTSALYEYDPLSQIHDLNLENARQRVLGTTDRRYAEGGDEAARLRESARGIGRYLRLGPLGTAFLPHQLPRVLLIDNLDLGDYDLPSDLIDLFESGGYRIPELARLSGVADTVDVGTDDPDGTAPVEGGRVLCSAFPVVVLTCASDHDVPPSLLRYCLPVRIAPPSEEELNAIVAAHFGGYAPDGSNNLVRDFLRRSADGEPLAIDQLLGAIQLVSEVNSASPVPTPDQVRHLSDMLWHRLRDDRG
ncbi:ATP-binding protein [Nocardiopsis aegyptia]|nr:AAA family ATPase [Nocardiopsis aegyptia]